MKLSRFRIASLTNILEESPFGIEAFDIIPSPEGVRITERPGILQILFVAHKSFKFEIAKDDASAPFMMRYSPGDLSEEEENATNDFNQIHDFFRKWLVYLERELEFIREVELDIDSWVHDADAFLAEHPEEEFKRFDESEQAILRDGVEEWQALLRKIAEKKSITNAQFEKLQAEFERLRSTLANDMKGKWYRARAKVGDMIKAAVQNDDFQSFTAKLIVEASKATLMIGQG